MFETIPLDIDRDYFHSLIEYAMRRICVICGKAHDSGRLYTSSDKCHQKFIDEVVQKYGEYKKVVDVATGKTHKVPTREILEKGLCQQDLWKYPEWKDENVR